MWFCVSICLALLKCIFYILLADTLLLDSDRTASFLIIIDSIDAALLDLGDIGEVRS